MEIGLFLVADGPHTPGRYPYEPYRSAGHHKLQTLLRNGSSPHCYYESAEERVIFIVVSCPEYGVLELKDFESTFIGAAS